MQFSGKSTELYFRETLNLTTTSYIVHPNMVDLSLSGSIGLVQDSLNTSGTIPTTGVNIPATPGSQSNNETDYEWNVVATILRNSTAPLTLQTQRSEQLIDRTFGSSFNDIQTSYSANWLIRSKTIPTSFRFQRLEDQQKSLLGEEDYSSEENSFEWQSEMHPTSNQTLSAAYHFSQTTERSGTGGSFDSQSQGGSVVDNLDFGARRQHNLSSSLDYSQDTGVIDIERLRINEILRLKHTDSFDTYWGYTFEDQTVDTTEQTSNRGMAGFRHQLYQSLTTTGHVSVSDTQLNDGSSVDDVLGDLFFDYRKKVPWGRLEANLSFSYDVQDSTARSAEAVFVNQPFTLSVANPIVIRQQDIDVSSLKVYDATLHRWLNMGTRPDFQIIRRPDGVELLPTFSGPVPVTIGDATLVTYGLLPEPANTVTTDTIGVGARYTFEETFLRNLSVYANYLIQDQSISASQPTLVQPDSIRDLILGLDYRIWDITFTAEQESHNSTVAPYDATRLRPAGEAALQFPAD